MFGRINRLLELRRDLSSKVTENSCHCPGCVPESIRVYEEIPSSKRRDRDGSGLSPSFLPSLSRHRWSPGVKSADRWPVSPTRSPCTRLDDNGGPIWWIFRLLYVFSFCSQIDTKKSILNDLYKYVKVLHRRRDHCRRTTQSLHQKTFKHRHVDLIGS